jgi:hypothetical protein
MFRLAGFTSGLLLNLSADYYAQTSSPLWLRRPMLRTNWTTKGKAITYELLDQHFALLLMSLTPIVVLRNHLQSRSSTPTQRCHALRLWSRCSPSTCRPSSTGARAVLLPVSRHNCFFCQVINAVRVFELFAYLRSYLEAAILTCPGTTSAALQDVRIVMHCSGTRCVVLILKVCATIVTGVCASARGGAG